MQTTATQYGIVDSNEYGATITATGNQLWEWAHRAGALWPCSELADLDYILAGFDSRGDLVELETNRDDDDITADELNAWSSDVLAAAGYSVRV